MRFWGSTYEKAPVGMQLHQLLLCKKLQGFPYRRAGYTELISQFLGAEMRTQFNLANSDQISDLARNSGG